MVKYKKKKSKKAKKANSKKIKELKTNIQIIGGPGLGKNPKLIVSKDFEKWKANRGINLDITNVNIEDLRTEKSKQFVQHVDRITKMIVKEVNSIPVNNDSRFGIVIGVVTHMLFKLNEITPKFIPGSIQSLEIMIDSLVKLSDAVEAEKKEKDDKNGK